MQQSRLMDVAMGFCIPPGFPCIGMVITASTNSFVNSMGVARSFDIVLAPPMFIGMPCTYSSTVFTNSEGNVRTMDVIVGAFTGIMITGSSNQITG